MQWLQSLVGKLFGSSRRRPVRHCSLTLEVLETRDCPSSVLTSANVRYSASANRIYVSGDVQATLSQIDALLPKAPLDLIDATNKVWLLRANLILENGATLNLHGSEIGGDVNELRLLSNNSSAANSFVEIKADWGVIDIDSTTIISWDQAANGPDTEYATYKRAFIRARSKLAADGTTPLESTMNIRNSDISYLGYNASESYGLSWKVNGTAGVNYSLFDKVEVFGIVSNSRLHHNYMGVYTYGGYGMQFLNNEVDYNVKYGLDFHDDSDWFVVEGNNVHHNAVGATSAHHGIIFSKRCDNAIVRGNISSYNGGNGIMMDRSYDDYSLIEDNTAIGNGDSGIAIFESSHDIIRNNILKENVKAGIRFSVGSANNIVTGNELAYNGTYGIYLYKGSDTPHSGDGRPNNNQFIGNLIHDNVKNAVKLGDADNNLFQNNQVYGFGGTLYLERGNANQIDGTSVDGNVLVTTKGSLVQPNLTYITNQANVRVKVDSNSTVVFTDPPGNVFSVVGRTIGTTITPSGSSLTLTKAILGNSSSTFLVSLRPFKVDVATASVNVTPILWETSGNRNKQWTSQSSAADQELSYTVGDLIPEQTYQVSKNGEFLSTLTADLLGTITFTDVVGSLNAVPFSVQTVLQHPEG